MIKKYPASLEALYDMLAFIREHSEATGFNTNHLFQIELATEEALVNIITYAYIHQGGDIEISCYNPESMDGIVIVITDNGVPYNPIAGIKSKPPNHLLEENVEGGLGIFFIMNIMDEVEYARKDERNTLTLIKYLL